MDVKKKQTKLMLHTTLFCYNHSKTIKFLLVLRTCCREVFHVIAARSTQIQQPETGQDSTVNNADFDPPNCNNRSCSYSYI